MNCKHCKKWIEDIEIAHYMAAKGGRKGGSSTSQAKREACAANLIKANARKAEKCATQSNS